MAATTFDQYGRAATQDLGASTPPGAPAAFSGNMSPVYVACMKQTAGAGTTANILYNVGVKSRALFCYAVVTAGVASSTVQLFTATGGGGTACSSAISTASAGTIFTNLTTATQVFALGSTLYAYASSGATLAGFELHVFMCPEQ